MVEVIDPSAGGKRGVGHEHVHGAGGRGELDRGVGLGEIGHQHLRAVTEACRELVERVPAPAAQQYPRAALM